MLSSKQESSKVIGKKIDKSYKYYRIRPRVISEGKGLKAYIIYYVLFTAARS